RLRVAPATGPRRRDAALGLAAARRDPDLLRLAQQLRDVRRVEERLGGDAADVHAYSPELIPLDHRRGHTELRRADRSDVAGGTAPEDDHVELVGHRIPLRAALREGSQASLSAFSGMPPR